MRVAVALPSLPKASPLRSALEAAFRALVDHGAEVESFAEDPRDHDLDHIETYHYLRLRERHEKRAFESALYPLGRDWRPYEPSLIAMTDLPGVVWVLDPVPHHIAVGGLAMRGRWDEYRALLERAFGERRGSELAMTVAAGWAVRSTYRRFDPSAKMLEGQRAVCAATAGIAAALGSQRVEVLPVPRPPTPTAASPRQRCSSVLVLSFHYGWPDPVLRALARLLDCDPPLELRVVVPELLQQVAIGPRASALGIEDRVTWVLPDEGLIAQHLGEVDLVVHLRDDPTAGEQALMDRGRALGVPAMTLRAPGVRALPPDVGPRVEPGRSLGCSLEEQILAIARDDELYRALSAAAMQAESARPGPEDLAERLVALLDLTAGGGLVEPPGSEPTWMRLRRTVRDAAMPAGASAVLRDLMEALLSDVTPEALRARGSDR